MFWILCTILGLVTETASVSTNTGLFSPLVTETLSSFNAKDSLSTLYHGSRFNSHDWRQTFVIELSDLFSFTQWFFNF